MSSEKKNSKMTKADLNRFRVLLLRQRAELAGDVTDLESEALKAAEEEVSVDHMADFGSDSYEQDQTIGFIEREGEALRAIEEALGRLDDGSFGLCDECGSPIKKTRLKAIPYARLCLKCQMAEEQS